MCHVQENIVRFYSKLNEMRKEEKFTDVTLECESKSFKCHRLVLIVGSPYFQAMFSSSFKESSIESIVLQEVSAATFENVLHFIYTGNVDVDATNVYNLLRVSDYYSLPGIKDLCLQFITNNQHLMTVENIFSLFLYSCDTKKNEFVSILSNLIAEHFSLCCKLTEFFEISFDHLEIILNQYWSSSSRNEESLLTAIMGWTCHKREERLQCLDKLFQMIQFESISPAYFKLMAERFVAGRDPVTDIFTKPAFCDTISELPKVKHLKTDNCLHVHVRYENESLIRIFSINNVNKCTNSGQISITEKVANVRFAVSDDLYLYCLNYLNCGPSEQNCEKQMFCAYTSVDRRVTLALTPPPIVFGQFVSLCYLQNNIYAYDGTHIQYAVVRTNSKNGKMFDDDEINRGIFVYNCSSDNWFPIPQRKKILWHSCMTVCEKTLYLIGGSESVLCYPKESYAQAFDFRSGWRTLPASRNKYFRANCCSLNGKIYVCGGEGNFKKAERYDPIANKWETIQSMTNDAILHRMIPFDNKLWVMGSQRQYSKALKYCPSNDLSMNVYNVTLNEWSKSSILTKAAVGFTSESRTILDGVVFGIL